nr:leucine-rich repeat-containing protein 20 isoform X2 [Dasypus novemcinctus]
MGTCLRGMERSIYESSLQMGSLLLPLPQGHCRMLFWVSWSPQTALRLEGNFLHRLPNEVSTLQHLKAIDLSRNKFRDFPEQLTTLPALETINLEQNEIVDVPVEKLAAMPALQSIDLRFNPLSAEVRVIAPPLIKFDMLMSPEGARPPPP